MKSNILTIMGKEFARFFGDRRMLLSLFLPGILIYVLYSFMGNAISKMIYPDDTNLPRVYVMNMPDSLVNNLSLWNWAELIENESENKVSIKEKIKNKEADLLIVFPSDFDLAVSTYDVTTSSEDAPNIEIYFNALESNSTNAYMVVTSILDTYESSLSNKFDVNKDILDSNLASDEETSASIIALMMPMLINTFLFTGCSSIGTESIAGEKERGTLGTLLVSPLKRSELALGKILSLGVLSFLIGLVSSLSTILSLPKLMSEMDSINVYIYSVKDYLLLALVILSTLLLLISLISIISAFAKSVKEATTSITPLMIVTMLIGVTGMFGDVQTKGFMYMIPLYNSVQCMSSIFSLSYSPINIVITILSNISLACIASFILTKMFDSEKIVFSK